MPFLRPLTLIAALCLPVLAAQPLSLHPGSTRDWVKRTGTSGDSVRYRLEFLDCTRRDSSSETPVFHWVPRTFVKNDTTVDWRVRITRSDSPSVADTAILRTLHSHWFLAPDSLPAEEQRRIEGIAYWLEPSVHFPLDLQYHSGREGSIEGVDKPLATGTWEALLLERAGGAYLTLNRNDDGILCDNSLSDGFCRAEPIVASRDSLGIVAWLSHGTKWDGHDGAFWELRGVDGKPLPSSPGSLGHRLVQGESWVYRDTNSAVCENTVQPCTTATTTVTLELVDSPRDSAGLVLLSLRKRVLPDSGSPTSSALSFALDTLRHAVRTASGWAAPWNGSDSLDAMWAMGLLRHLVVPESAKATYRSYLFHLYGEMLPERSIYDWGEVLEIDNAIGATRIRSEASSREAWSSRTWRHTWTLVAHALDNSILATSPKPTAPARDLAWLRTRIVQNPSLEVVRIGLDGRRASAHGTAALKLLDQRGVGIVQVRDGRELTTLRNANP